MPKFKNRLLGLSFLNLPTISCGLATAIPNKDESPIKTVSENI